MKKILPAMCIVLFVSLQSKSQSIDVKAGVTVSDWRGDGINALNSLVGLTGQFVSRTPFIGYYAGVSGNVPLSSTLSFQPGLVFTQTGTSLRGNLGLKGISLLNINAQVNMIQQRIEMPLMVKAALGNGLEVFAGPQASYQLSSKLQMKATALGFNLLNRKLDMQDNFEPLNVSAIAGLQYRLPNGLGIAASYEHGITSIVKDRSAKVFTKSARVGLSYQF